MANCAEHADIKHGGWCVICLREALEQIASGELGPSSMRLLAAEAAGIEPPSWVVEAA